MAAEAKLQIPILTDAVDSRAAERLANAESTEILIAELQTQLAASAFALTDEILRTAFAEMEASIFEQISGRLRRELPELIDTLLRERLGIDQDY
jgi:hypothetical protein